MGVIITKQEDIVNYFNSSSLGQSTAKRLLEGLDAYKSNFELDPTKPYLIIGSAVDLILTGEEGEFEKQYCVTLLDTVPSETIKLIVDKLYQIVTKDAITVGSETYENLIDVIACEVGYQKRWKKETRIADIIKKGQEYFKELDRVGSRTLLSKELYSTIQNVVTSLKTNPRTAKYFDRKQQQLLTNVDFYYQLPIYFEYKGISCKALMDLVVVIKDETGKIVSVEPYDLKTMSGPTLSFLSSMRKRRYDIQAAWYTEAVKHRFNVTEDQIKPFTFIVESTTNPGIRPLLFKCSEKLLKIGKTGREGIRVSDIIADVKESSFITYPIKGMDNILDEIDWLQENNLQDDKIVLMNQGILTMDWDEIF